VDRLLVLDLSGGRMKIKYMKWSHCFWLRKKACLVTIGICRVCSRSKGFRWRC